MKLIKDPTSFTVTDFSWNRDKYKYKKFTRNDDNGPRTYNVNDKKVPSVTTILSATKSQESRDALQRWRDKVGELVAKKITTEAANRGTEMHYVLEQYINGVGYLNLSGEGAHARLMAHKIIENLEPLNIIYGSEVYLHYKDLYAGATDLVGVHDGKPAIIDFKQANKLKVRQYIEDYYFQIAAYALAHEWAYGPIEKGCICICTKDFEYQQFTLDKGELDRYKEGWINKVEQFNRAML
jgi:ATP-dependent exoDNAse (exonuclease V) beta subunit